MNDRPLIRSLINAILSAVLATLGVYFSTASRSVGKTNQGKDCGPVPGTQCCICTPAPAPAPAAPKEPAPDALNAIVRIQISNSGCSATVIGPRRSDGRYELLSASHCTSRIGERGTARTREGKTFGFMVIARDEVSDCAWLLTDTNSEKLPYALLSERAPPVGAKVWHAGFGIDNPGNREEGLVEALPDQNGQCRYRLSVSSGDSGGGICLDESGRVCSAVCCTTAKGRIAQVWGCSPESAARLRPKQTTSEEWSPLEIPVRPAP